MPHTNVGVVSWCIFITHPPPSPCTNLAHTIQKHWNRMTNYVKTGEHDKTTGLVHRNVKVEILNVRPIPTEKAPASRQEWLNTY